MSSPREESRKGELRELFDLKPSVVWAGTRVTTRRVQNLIRARQEEHDGALELRSYPVKLTLEVTNLCNLKCPACFTGIREIGRPRGEVSLDLVRRLLGELGPYLFELELCTWGEPLLHRGLATIVGEARDAGVSTLLSTNFSLPFDDRRADELVRSGLTVLGVSLDGATQRVYEQYRVGGDIRRVIDNCRRIRDARRRLRSTFPRLIWGYHVFPHNTEEIDLAREMARELEMEFVVSKGWVEGPDWDPQNKFPTWIDLSPARCRFLWHHAVVNNDGGVSPCCASFYREHDMGHVSVDLNEAAATSFRDVWNGEKFRRARGLFGGRASESGDDDLLCTECPLLIDWRRFQDGALAGEGRPGQTTLTPNQLFNHFWVRRPNGTAAERGVVQLRRKVPTI